ncbi:MAG: PaaI family thioesterase [Flavobacteriia bacterium]|jgi:acyl-CoA thioesterase
MKNPSEIVNQMLKNDAFSQWLNIEVLEVNLGNCRLQLEVSKQMLNGFSIAHGGITYSLADSSLAFASNSYGFKAVSIETSISHLKKVLENDTLTAVCSEISRGKTIGKYESKIYNQENELVAHFLGTVYISKEIW